MQRYTCISVHTEGKACGLVQCGFECWPSTTLLRGHGGDGAGGGRQAGVRRGRGVGPRPSHSDRHVIDMHFESASRRELKGILDVVSNTVKALGRHVMHTHFLTLVS